MGLGMYVSLERDLAGVDPLGIDGKALARAMFALDGLAAKLQVPTIKSMLSVDRKEALDFLEDIGVDPDEVKLPDEAWYPAAEGRRTVRGYVEHLQKTPQSVPNAERVLC